MRKLRLCAQKFYMIFCLSSENFYIYNQTKNLTSKQVKFYVHISLVFCLIWALNRKNISNVKTYYQMLLKQTNIRILEHSFMLCYLIKFVHNRQKNCLFALCEVARQHWLVMTNNIYSEIIIPYSGLFSRGENFPVGEPLA